VTSPGLLLVCAGVGSIVFAACSPRPAAPAGPAGAAPAASAASASAADKLTPQAAHTAPTAASTISGTVVETMDASNYTYVRVKADAGEVWAAAAKFPVAVGDTVSFSREQPMENFHSAALKRDFPLIYFVPAIARNGEPPAGMPPGHPAVGGGTAPAAATGKIEPAKGGTTVQTVWATREALAGHTVTIRGKVVKFNGGILGVNWLHIQDGTGSASDGSNDLTVTSDADAQVGDVVSITGTVTINKDLGSGYKYPVIVEHARLARE
jgi:hypothetical protein